MRYAALRVPTATQPTVLIPSTLYLVACGPDIEVRCAGGGVSIYAVSFERDLFVYHSIAFNFCERSVECTLYPRVCDFVPAGQLGIFG